MYDTAATSSDWVLHYMALPLMVGENLQEIVQAN